MFKIESYITPLLMGYLDKYVRLRPEDFQLSLWGGDAVLYNLDLRLDIIEKAIQLPIVFQSGHIHELRLHVPWTKLGSDPVVVTINTIECILKLRDTAYEGRSSRASSESPRKLVQKQKTRKQDSADLPPGYLQSLMNKIVNNVSIIVNNLIVKFVEDDIVLSLNVKSAECYSVDKNWDRTFVDLFAPDFVLRRTVNFCDVTVCLDKRDASGKIDHYQDPMVYRCSVVCRLYTKYENIHSKYPLETKLNIYCERLDLSLTDVQLPMFLRLIELCLALYYGTLDFKKLQNKDEPDQQSVDRETKDNSVGEPPPEHNEQQQQQQGWASWAWSYVPQILPEDEDELEPEARSPRKPPPSIFSLGMYAYKTTIKFKMTEYIKEKAHYGPKKIVFKPFLYLESEGISFEVLMQDYTFFNAQFGITSISVYSQGICICGAEGEENSRNNLLFSGGDSLQNKTTTNYICQSLFDAQSSENLGVPITKILDFDEHRQIYTEQYGLQKYGVFWMDYLYGMAKQDDKDRNTSSKSSVSSVDSSTVFVQENSLSRFVVGRCHLNISSTTVHRIQTVIDAAYRNDYEPYSKPQEERVDESRPHPTEEQLKSLDEFIPTRTYHLTFLQPIISVLSAEHPYCDIAKKKYHSPQAKGKASQPPTLHPLFGMQITSQRFDLQTTSPMYPRKTVQMISKIIGPSSNLMHHCHSHTQTKIFGLQVGLTKVDIVGSRSPVLTIVPPTSGALYTRRLLLPMYWKNSYLPKLEKVYELPQFSVNLSKPSIHVVMAIISSWKQNIPKPSSILSNSLMDDVFPSQESGHPPAQYPVLEMSISGFEMKSCKNDIVTACSTTLSSVHVLVYTVEKNKTTVTPILSCPNSTDVMHTSDWLTNENSSNVEEVKNDCLMLTYQLPRKYDKVQAPAVVLVNMEGTAVCLDPILVSLLSYKPVTKVTSEPQELKVELDLALVQASLPLQTNLSQVSVPSSGSKIQTSISFTQSPTLGNQSTQTAGNQKPISDENKEPESIGTKLARIFPLIRVLQVQVEIKKTCIFIPKYHLDITDPSVNIVGNLYNLSKSRSLCDMLVLCLPRLTIQSAGMKTMSAVQEIPITSVEGSLVGDKIPWNVSLQNMSAYTVHSGSSMKTYQLVKPATVSCTVGVSFKYTPPTSDNISALGLCLHTDLRSIIVSTSVEQIKLLMDIGQSTTSIAVKLVKFFNQVSQSLAAETKPTYPSGEPKLIPNIDHSQTKATSATSVSHSDIPFTHTSGDVTSLDTSLSRDLEILDVEGDGVKLSLWLQCTLPKCEMRLYLRGKQDTKISAILEDITLSVDIQEVYSKLKINIGAASILHYDRHSDGGEWKTGINEGVLMSCRDVLSRDTQIVSSRLWSKDRRSSETPSVTMFIGSQPSREISHGFFSLTLTRALRKNVRKRLQKLNIEIPILDYTGGSGDMFSQFHFHKYVSEICINMTPCDFILCMPPIAAVLANFSSFDASKSSTQKRVLKENSRERTPAKPSLTTSNLPLLYAEISSMRLFLPGEKTEKNKNGVKTTLDCDMFMFQVQSINITPHAENPLPRYAVDKELYQKAVQLGITAESGAAMSDKQFQVDVKGFSFTSGCWSDILKCKRNVTERHTLTPGTQIPAVEWNSLTIREDNEEVQLFPILSPCDLKLVLAPAMVNYTPQLGESKLKMSLVCGHGIEFNIISDLDLHVSTNQIHLMHAKLTNCISTLSMSGTNFDDNTVEKDSVQDSGIGSEVSATTNQKSNIKLNASSSGQRKVNEILTPIDLLLTAGRISCTFYSHVKTDKEITLGTSTKPQSGKKKEKTKKKPQFDWRVNTNSENDQNDYSDYQDPYLMRMYQLNLTSEEKVIPAGTTCIKPFLFCYISQPHTVLSCQPDIQKFETSSYDVLVKGSTEMSYIPVSDVKLLPDCSDFTEYWLETRAGQPHPSTGIPASLYTLTISNFLTIPAKISVKLERPMKTNISFSKIMQAQDFYSLLFSQHNREEKTNKRPTGSLDNNTSEGTLSILGNISCVDFQTDQIVVAMETKSCEENPELITSFSNFKSHIEFHHSDNELDSVLMNTYMRDLLVKTGYEKRQLNMLGPCSIKGDGTYTRIQHAGIQERWSQTVVTIATGLVTMHFGQEHALCLKVLRDHVQEFMEELSLRNPKTKNETKQGHVSIDKSSTPPHVDFVLTESRDDLRSHEFEYIMDTDGKDLVPRSGEIVFCNKDMEDNSSMTWSYNEPRVISHMSSTPVPFFVSDVQNTYGNKIPCALQYWECLIQQFIDYVDFDLLENDTTQVMLPRITEFDKRNLVASQIWRVLIRNTEGQVHVLPATLAASLNVTSCFIPSLIPSVQLGLTVESSQLHLTNHVHCLGKETPSKLTPFYMSNSYQPTGEFAVISLDNILIAGTCMQNQQNISQIQFSSQLAVDLLEFKTLTMERVVSAFNICGNSHITHTCKNQANEKSVNMLDMDISCDPVTVRVGKGIVHNLATSIDAWSQIFKDDTSEETEVIFTHYVICNNTQLPIRFGQLGTDENLVLPPREMYQYAWRSHIMKQELHVCMDGSIWKWCDSLDINKPGRYSRKISTLDHPYTLIITINRLSNVQNQVIISGLLTVSNRLSMNIEVKVNTSEREYQAIAGSDNILPSYIIQPNSIHDIKLRPYGGTADCTWSQEIHIGNIDTDVSESSLVKISEGTRTFHIWCQIIVRNIDSHPCVYIVLCPLYTLRSHLPQQLYVNIDTSKLNLHECIETPGRGRDTQLKCPGGDIHQSLTFQFSANSGRSNNCVTLSTGLIDQLHRSPLDDLNYDSLYNYWRNDTWFEWPYSQPVKLEPDTPKPDIQNIMVPDVGIINQPTIDLNISLSELWPGYQTILVNVAPSYLVNNYTELDLTFMGTEDVTFDIHKGHTICPPKLESSFHVGIKSGDIIHMSEPIPVSDEEVDAQRYRNDIGKTLYMDSYINIPVVADNNGLSQILYLTVRSCFKHQIRIITITEQYNISNLTKYNLRANIVSIPRWSDKVDFPSSEGFDLHSKLGCHRDKSDLDPVNFHSLLYNTNSDKKYNIDQNTDFIKYLSLRNNVSRSVNKNRDQPNLNEEKGEELLDRVDGDWSFPIRLVTNDSGCRMTTSLGIWKKNKLTQESLCITGIEKNGVTYFTVQLDQSPVCYINNECNFPLHVGQTLMNLSLSGITTQEETELINTLPTIPVGGAMYYTPPYLNSTFPQVNDKHSIPKLHLSGSKLDQNDSTKLKWSNPIDLHIAADNFVSIPAVADVKIHIQQVAMVTYITISPITKADISAKEIRSRLKGHEKNVIIENEIVDPIDSKCMIANSLKQSLDNEQSGNEEKLVEKKTESVWKVSCGVLVYKLSFIIQDENTPYSRGETIRLTLDNLFLAQYPASDIVDSLSYYRNCVVCSVGDLQLDNQLHSNGNFDFPVVTVRQASESNKYVCDIEQLSQLNMVEKHAVLKCDSILHIQLVFGSVNGRSSVIETVECAMKPMSFYVEDTFIYHCIKEAEGFLQVPMSIPEPLPVAVRKLPSVVKSLSKSISSPIVIGQFCIQPVTMMMSVHASIKVFIASDHTPLSFGKFEKSYLRTTSYQLTRVLVMHYASGALFRAGAVVGSLEILGNPTGLVRSIGSGVADFFRMPYQGLTRGPGAFVKGISSGTSSMVKNISTGMLTSLTNFASSVSRNMDRLSLDSTHVRRQEEGRRHRPDGVSEGLKQGLTGLGISLLGAVAGLADQPIQSLVDTEDSQSKTSTASGLVTGVGKGLVGVFTKPIGGAAEFVSQTGQGILHGTGLSRMPSARITPDIIKLSTVPCGQVKYSLKLLQTLPSNDILCCVDAMFINLTDNEEPVTLILTPEVLFVVNHEEDSQQQSFSILELECGVTQGDEPILSIIWRDSQTFNEDQLEPSHAERVTAFVDAATKYISTDPQVINALEDDKHRSLNVGLVHQTVDNSRQGKSLQNNQYKGTSLPFDQYQGTSLQHDQYNEERQSSDVIQGEQISDTVSDSSVEQLVCGSFPQYDFKMRPTSLAAFLALFNITQHRLAGVGFVV
ncbi:Vacuolar protein sorting-associated protein 13B [Mactra antiquata]